MIDENNKKQKEQEQPNEPVLETDSSVDGYSAMKAQVSWVDNAVDVVGDVAQGVVAGTQSVLNETAELGEQITGALPVPTWAEQPGYEEAYFKIGPLALAPINKVVLDKGLNTATPYGQMEIPETLPAELSKGITQVGLGLFGASKLLAPVKATSAAGVVGKTLLTDVVASTVYMDEQEGNLFNVLNEYAPQLSTPLSEYLATDEDDSWLEGKFKNAVEAGATGLIGEMVFKAAKGLKGWKKAAKSGDDVAKAEAIQQISEAADEALDTLYPGMPKSNPDVKPQKFRPTKESKKFAEALQKHIDDGTPLEQIDISNKINPDTFLDPEQTARVQQALEEAAGSAVFGKSKKVTHKEFAEKAAKQLDETVAGLSDLVGEDKNTLQQLLVRNAGSVEKASINAWIARQFLQATENELVTIAKQVSGNPLDTKSADKFLSLFTTYKQLVAPYKGLASEFGRGLNQYQNNNSIAEELQKVFTSNPENLTDLAQAVEMADKAAQRKLLQKGLVDGLNMYRVSNMVSGFSTQLMNIAGNTSASAIAPVETMLTGLYSGDTALVREGAHIFEGYSRYLYDAVVATGKAFRQGRAITRGAGTTIETMGPAARLFSYDDVTKTIPNGLRFIAPESTKWMWNTLGDLGGGGLRMLSTGDEFFYNLNYRAHRYAQLSRQAAANGIEKGPEFEKFINDEMSKSFDKLGQAIDVDSRKYASYNTFSNEWEAEEGFFGEAGKWVEKARNSKHHGMQLVSSAIFPFIRTPLRAAEYTLDRLPGFNTDIWKWGSLTQRERAEVAAKATTGTLAMSLGAVMAAQGLITENESTDSTIAQSQRKTNWEPNSLRISLPNGDEAYFPISRLGPVGYMIIAGRDIVNLAPYASKGEIDELSNRVLADIVGQFETVPFLQGMEDLGKLLGDAKDGEISNLLNNYATSLVPLGGLSNDIRKQVDPYSRETKTLMDRIRNRLPGTSNDLPVKRDLLGNPVPGELIPLVKVKHTSPASKEIERLVQNGATFAPITNNKEGLDLYKFRNADGRTAYDAYGEGIAENKFSGRNLTEQINRLISKDGYSKLTDPFKVKGTTDTSNQGGKAYEIKKLMQDYKKAAFQKLLKDNNYVHSETGVSILDAYKEAKRIRGIKTEQQYTQALIDRESETQQELDSILNAGGDDIESYADQENAQL